MPDFDLHQIVLDVLADSRSSNTHDLAMEVLSRIPRNRVRDALGQTLPGYVAQVRAASPRRMPVAQPSPKVAGIRSGWHNQLRAQVHVGAGMRKPLGECTHGDLMFAANEKAHEATELQAQSRRFTALARLVLRAGVATLAEVPVEQLSRALARAA